MTEKMNNKISVMIVNFHATLRSVVLLLLCLMVGVGEAWADTWDGTTKTAPDMTTNNGSSEALAIQISKAAELAWLGDQMRQGFAANGKTYGGKYWKLTADIDLGGKDDLTGKNWSEAIGNTTNSFCGYFDGGGHTVSNIQVASITSAKYYGLFPSIQGASSSNLSKVKNLKIDGVYLKATTSMGATTRIGALTGYVKNGSISGVTASKVNITYVDGITGANNIGGLIGFVEGASGGQTTVRNNSVTNVKISIGGAIAETTYIGGAIGIIGVYTLVDGMSVNGGSITGPATDKTVTNNKTFFVGGFLGYQNSSGTGAFQANKFKNVAVTGMNINFGHYVPASDAPIENHKFSVGGIAGSVNAPNMQTDGKWGGMPENLISKGGKIYAPWASTSPIVGNFNAAAATHQNMTLDQVTSVDAIEKAKANTWYYNDYKLGLSSEFLSSTSVIAENAQPEHLKFRKNYSKATENIDGIQYLSIDNSTLTRDNRYQDSERDLKTVLWWTQQASMDKSKGTVAAVTCFTANEQPIYPQSGAKTTAAGNLADYPYYMYFFQGVGNAKYVSKTDAENLVKGIVANITNDVMSAVAVASETNLNVSITNDGENRRGFDDRTLSVTVKQGNTDVTGNYTYQWYLDGKADGSGTTKTLTPHWKDGQGITVNVLSGTTIVASASYGFAPGMLHTKASAANATAELLRSDYTKRGTSVNPYVIDCESALRQLSYLSTAHTSIRWDGVQAPTVDPKNQTQGHYNRAYYELSADIDLGNSEFTPISHVGYGSDGSWGTYNVNWIFQGVFDGQGHTISNFKITWGASQYVGNNANLYYGLFGAIGGATATQKWGDNATSNTTVKNLIIDGATLIHNTSEKSFYYDQSISTNASNCMLGVLAGIVSSNTTIKNIEIRSSKITDEGSSDYSLATRGLYVGGAIGSMQHAYGTTDVVMTNTQVQHIAAQVAITLTHPTFVDPSAKAQVNQFNIGGIIGRYIATKATQEQAQSVMPAYTIYSGTINAPKAWISPVLASVRYTSQNGNDFNNYSKQWEGNNNSAATQITIKNALFYDFYIGGEKITDTFPSNTCGFGFRTMTAHTNGSDAATIYSAQKYQGVNYDATWVSSYGDALTLINSDPEQEYHWFWKDGFVHLSTDPYIDAILSREGNTFTATLVGGTATAYRWEISFDTETWHDIADVTNQTYAVHASPKEKNVRAYISDGTNEYPTMVMKVDAITDFCAPSMSSADDPDSRTYTANLNAADPSAIAHLTIEYQWKDWNQEVIPGVTGTSHSISQDEVAQNHELVWCKITLKELGEIMAEYNLIGGGTVIFVNGNGYAEHGANPGNDTNDGLTPQTPVLTIDQANSLLKTPANGGTWDNNIIVVMGILDNDYIFQSSGHNPTTLTGKWNGVDYEGVIRLMQVDPAAGEHTVNNANRSGQKGANCYVLHDTKFENLTFYGKQGGNCFIDLHGHDALFGKGLIMQNFAKLSASHGNFGSALEVPEFTIILTATNLPKEDIEEYTRNRTKPQEVTFQSGHYGRILAGRFTQNWFADADNNTAHSILASATDPLWAVINIDIDKDNEMTDRNGLTYTCDINAIIAGLTDGTMYGDMEINFHGGNVAYIVGSNQGNAINNGDAEYTPIGSTKSGSFGQWPNSSYFGRTVINIDQDPTLKNITVGNLYAGGLGRKVQAGDTAGAPVDMYLYGQTVVNVKSGTVGSVYGGGVGGVIGVNPWDAHTPYVTTAAANDANAIQNGVQYGDTRQGGWSSLVAGKAKMAKVTLHNWNKGTSQYDAKDLDLSESSTTINVTGGNINGSLYGGGYGYVPDMPAASVVQGVGSVFGTSNINIFGGNISGSVYGGSQGSTKFLGVTNQYGQTINHIAEMNGTVNLTISGTEAKYPVIGGSIYGAGQGIPSEGDKDYLRIATTGDYDLAGPNATDEQKKKYQANINITIDMPESVEFPNDIYGGGALGLVDGNTNIILQRGTFTGNIYGGGFGEKGHLDKAMVTGNTYIYLGDSIIANIDRSKPVNVLPIDPMIPTLYGGGNMAQVKGNTNINIYHGNVSADVFGGGKGLTMSESAGYKDYGKVTGNTNVIIYNKTENNKLVGTIFGGGALGDVEGNTNVVVKAGDIDGDIFGGGKGEDGNPDKAKVTGSTNVKIGE